MLKQTLLMSFIGIACGIICNQQDGFWLNSHAEGVTNFAYGGVPLNSNYNCFQGNLTTEMVDQAFKVAFNGSAPSASALLRVKEPIPGKRTINTFSATNGIDDDVDLNKMNCVDPMVREGVASAIKTTADRSCQGIVKTILFNLNLSQWAVDCVDFNRFQQSDVISDYNFCHYQARIDDNLYIIRMAKIDIS